MADTYTGICKVCNIETDLIEGICGNCSLVPQYTSGPWEVTETLGQTAVTIPHSKIGIAFDIVCHISKDIRKGNPDGNARLIASAPDCYEALRTAPIKLKTETLEQFYNTYKSWYRTERQQAIIKAEGGK